VSAPTPAERSSVYRALAGVLRARHPGFVLTPLEGLDRNRLESTAGEVVRPLSVPSTRERSGIGVESQPLSARG
jgi:hypothetical protein